MGATQAEQVRAELARRELARRNARRHLLAFTRHTFAGDGRVYDTSWYHELLAGYLERWAVGDIKRLLITAPPQHGKSELANRRLVPWLFGLDPHADVMAASHTDDYANFNSRAIQATMEGEAYRALNPAIGLYRPGQRDVRGQALRRQDQFILRGGRGSFKAFGKGSTPMGRNFSHLIIDDPLKGFEEAHSAAAREHLWNWYANDMFTRRQPGARIMVVETRWHAADLTGRLLEAMADGTGEAWVHVHLEAVRTKGHMTVKGLARAAPEEAEPEEADDPREEGEALWPSRYPLEELAPAMRFPTSWGTLYQGRPGAEGGNVFKRAWFHYYTDDPLLVAADPTGRLHMMPALEDFDQVLISVDCAFKKTAHSSAVCLQAWGKQGANFYLLDEVRRKMGFVETLKALAEFCTRWPEARVKLVEDKANGSAVIDLMRKTINGLVAVNPGKDSKVARAQAVAPYYEAGNVLVPHVAFLVRGLDAATWAPAHVEELALFPSGEYNDRVDTASQALLRFTGGFKLRLGGLSLSEAEDELVAARQQRTGFSNRARASEEALRARRHGRPVKGGGVWK